MTQVTNSAFDLPGNLAAKADLALIAGDDQHFAAIAETLEQSIADLVILVDPEEFGEGTEGAAGRYVAMTRATQQLVILTSHGARL